MSRARGGAAAAAAAARPGARARRRAAVRGRARDAAGPDREAVGEGVEEAHFVRAPPAVGRWPCLVLPGRCARFWWRCRRRVAGCGFDARQREEEGGGGRRAGPPTHRNSSGWTSQPGAPARHGPPPRAGGWATAPRPGLAVRLAAGEPWWQWMAPSARHEGVAGAPAGAAQGACTGSTAMRPRANMGTLSGSGCVARSDGLPYGPRGVVAASKTGHGPDACSGGCDVGVKPLMHLCVPVAKTACFVSRATYCPHTSAPCQYAIRKPR